MNKDFRIAVGFFRHPKILKLKRRAGVEGVLAWLQLLSHVAENKPTGTLDGLSPEDIALAVDWQGDPEAIVRTWVDLRLIEESPEGLRIHDWQEHNGYAAKAPERVKHARNMAEQRHLKRQAFAKRDSSKAESGDKDSADTSQAMPEGDTSNAASMNKHNAEHQAGNAPTPDPVPDPVPVPDTNTMSRPATRPSVSSSASRGFPKLYRFEDWYSPYPRKEARSRAETAWDKVLRRKDFSDDLVDQMISAVERAKQTDQWRRGVIPHPATWLNERRWEDELPAGGSAPASPGTPAPKPWEQFEEGSPEYIEARRKAIRLPNL